MRFARLDLRARPGRPPPRPKAPWVPPRPPGPPRKPPPPPGRPPKPPPAPGPPPPGRAPAAPGRAPPRAGRSPGRATAERSGIIPGLGRAPPGRGPAAPAPPGPPAPPGRVPGRLCGRGIPWLGANGLLPGRAAASRERPMPWFWENGLLPGRGVAGRGAPGRGAPDPEPPSRAAGATGAAGAVGAAGAAGAAGAGGAGATGAADAGAADAAAAGAEAGAGAGDAGAGVAGAGAGVLGAGAGGALAAGAVSAGAAGAAGAEAATGAAGAEAATGAAGAAAAGAGRAAGVFGAAAGAAAWGASAGNFSLYRRTTGVSIVELALLTYSPMPFRRSRRTLLVTPSSLASALTRTLDTSLLSRSVLSCADRRYSWGVLIAEYSSGAHQRQTRFRFLLSDGESCSWALTQCSTAVESGGVLLRSARPNARRRTARSRHERTGCSHAPRPGRRCSGSGRTTVLPSTPGPRTTRRSADRLSAPRHPMHVRTGWPGRSPVRSVCTSLPPRGAGARHQCRWGPAPPSRCPVGCRSASR